MNRLASRKLLVAGLAIAAVTLNHKWGMGLSPDEIQAVVDITLTAIGSQAGIDLAERALPFFTPAPGAKPERRPADADGIPCCCPVGSPFWSVWSCIALRKWVTDVGASLASLEERLRAWKRP